MRSSTAITLILLLTVPACRRGPEIATPTATNTRVEAAGFNGESYQTRTGQSAITLISSDELEYRISDGTTLLCKYTDQGTALRVIVTALGTQQVMYFRRVPNGLMSNDGDLYLNATGLAALRRQEEIARQQQLEAEAAAERARAEAQRREAIAAQQEADRQAEQTRISEERARQQAEENRRETLKSVEASNCTEGEYSVAARSELVFMLSVQRQCWTPWLLPENKYHWGVKESGDVLVQFRVADGTVSKEFEDGPGKSWAKHEMVYAVRFKSLGKEPVRIAFNVQ